MKLDSLSDFTSYDPEVFRDLAQLLRHFKTLWQYRTDSRAWLDRLPERMKTALLSLDIDSLVRHLQSQVHSKAAALTHIERWFDGFRTLKFIHHLQAHSFPQILFTEALLRANDILDNPLEPGDLVLGPNGIQFTKTGTPNRR
ncbi:hypothetical protein F6455_14945 [Proteobacteria bacterium 005FR1]|nr:hypothetical protein [Proteobacteria bacterium 005FR1]